MVSWHTEGERDWQVPCLGEILLEVVPGTCRTDIGAEAGSKVLWSGLVSELWCSSVSCVRTFWTSWCFHIFGQGWQCELSGERLYESLLGAWERKMVIACDFSNGTWSPFLSNQIHCEPCPRNRRRKVAIVGMVRTKDGKEEGVRFRGGKRAVRVDGREKRRQGRGPRRDVKSGRKCRSLGKEAPKRRRSEELKLICC